MGGGQRVKTMYGRQFATMVSMVLLSFLMLGASFATLSYQYTIREKKDAPSSTRVSATIPTVTVKVLQ